MYKIIPYNKIYDNQIIELRNEYIDYLRQPYFLNEASQNNWYENTKDQYFVIVNNVDFFHDDHFLGCVGITNLDLVNRKAELSLITIDYLKNDIADFALDFVERYVFEKLNLRKLFITAFDFDEKKKEYFNNRYGCKLSIFDNVYFKDVFWQENYYSILDYEWEQMK
jgi:RimJ/RimL family protein N-acetyltransferase